ncbi:MAG: heat shock protein HspQ [Planctomycetales bacterium]|jgi:heat shock protein HspQ
MIALNDSRESQRFEVGTLVQHRRYGYCGVVVAVDEVCRADDAWYKKNQTQPDRDQPWHHVLVHGTPSVTYSAGQNLMLDSEVAEIHHPLVAEFFSSFDGKKYVRNDRPWPG